MVRVVTSDRYLEGETAAEVVDAMLRGRLGDSTMEEVARRAEVWSGQEVRAERAEDFLRDLDAAGIILLEVDR